MYYYFDEKRIIEYSKRYSERIKNANVNLDEIKNDSRLSGAYRLLFEKRFNNFFSGDSLYLEGTDPLVSFDYVYYALNKKTFNSEPWYMVMDQCADFFELYDANIQDRSSFIATTKIIKAEVYIVPLFIVFLNYRNMYSKLTPVLLVHNGQIIFRFEQEINEPISTFSIKKSIFYDLLVNKLKLEDKKVVDFILENELIFEPRETVLTIRKQLYPLRHSSKKERIINYIKAKHVVSAQELAVYFNLSKRMINYYIAELIDEGIVIREGEINSSTAKYRINADNYFF